MVDKIVSNDGLVLSEFPLKMEPRHYTFPQRNRIVAGIWDFVFVPEAGKGSGSLITVDFANEMNTSVYATPNSIFAPNSRWVNEYIAENKIQAVSNIDKFVKEKLGVASTVSSKSKDKTHQNKDLSAKEKSILDVIASKDQITQQELTSKVDYSTWEILTTLTKLEMKWLIYEPSSGVYKIG